MIEDIYQDTKEKMTKAIDSFKHDLQKVRTGRASLNLLDGIRVDYYGTLTHLNQMASLAVPEARMITIQPWDSSILKEIEKAILKSNIGLTPANDGKMIRIAIPPLTADRRKEIVKSVQKMSEDKKVSIRNIRRDTNELLKTLKKDGDISEDESFKSQNQIQKITDDYIKIIDDLEKEKETEILEF
ncbi:MAG: ribosome recycling factor [Desulfobacterales bacterium]|nr:ribosome recycling factor [Desulfobacterales bacterium]